MKKIKTITIVFIIAIVTVFAVGCTPSYDSMKKNFKDEGYTIIKVNPSEIGIDDSDIEYAFLATKVVETATVVCFKDKKTAEDFKSNFNDESKNIVIKGKIVAFGSEGALKLVK